MLAEATALNVPDIRCDSSAIGCLLAACDYFHIEPHGGGDFERLLESAQGGDVAQNDLVRAAQDLGLEAVVESDLSYSALGQLLSAGIPVITEIGAQGYVVVVGISNDGFMVHDPLTGPSEMSWADWANYGIILDAPEAERHASEHTVQPEADEHRDLAHHYANLWNVLHEQGERVPHWELAGAHENLAGGDWHVDLGHDGVWRPMHHEDMQRVYLWPAVEKSYGAGIEKARKKPKQPERGLFGWESNEDAPKRHPQSSEAFEGLHPRRGQGDKGAGRFAKLNTGNALGQQSLFGGEYEERNRAEAEPPAEPARQATGGVTLAGELHSGDFERLHPRQPKGEHGGQFAPKDEGATGGHAEQLAKEEETVKNAERQAGSTHPKATEARERKLVEERAPEPPEPKPEEPETSSSGAPKISDALAAADSGGLDGARDYWRKQPPASQLSQENRTSLDKEFASLDDEFLRRKEKWQSARDVSSRVGSSDEEKQAAMDAYRSMMRIDDARKAAKEWGAGALPGEDKSSVVPESKPEDKEQRRLELERQAVELGMLPSRILSPEHQQELNGLYAEKEKRILKPSERARIVALEMARRMTPEEAEMAVKRAYALGMKADEGKATSKEREDLEDLKNKIGTDDAGLAYKALEQLSEISSKTRKAGEPETPVDLPKPVEENVTEQPKPTEEPHVEPEQPRATESEPAGRPGDVSESERRGDDSGSVGGNDRAERPASSGPRIVTARSEHTQTADPGLVPESLRGHLNEYQQQDTALAIDAMTKHGGFLTASGTGTGKTRVQLAVAQHFLQQGRKVVIVSPAEVIKPDWKKGTMSGSFANDSAAMGVSVKLTKGDGEIAPGTAHVTTYNELNKLKNQIDKNTVVIFDESHFMKNRDSARFKHGNEIMEKAAAVMYATATPGDKPLHIAHLARAGVFGNVGKKETYEKLGMQLVDQRVYGGGTVKVWQIDKRVGYKEAARRLSGLFDQLTQDGLMVKHELAMNNVQFQADRVALKEEEHAAIQKVYEDKLKETASRAFPDGNKAVALMAARMAQEPYKIQATVDMIKSEMEQGRSPIVFLGRVNDISDDEEKDGEEPGEINYGTAGLLREALIAAGISESDIGELHGAATKTPDAKKKAMEKFQAAKTKLMIATVQSGGTGINLDDTTGERPRTVIMMTPPFTANDMAQAIGRVHRLNTKSNSRVRGVLADTDIDDWNAGILEKKFRTLGALVQGESTRGQSAYTPPEEIAEEKPKEPFEWGESLKSQPKVFHNTPFAHNNIIGEFGGRRVNQGGEWTTQFPSKEHLERYRQHVLPKPSPPAATASSEQRPEKPARPAEETPKPQAPPMSAARKEAIHQGLRQLHAANEDRAREQNGEGFNKFDSDFGGQLAEQSSLSDRQAEVAAKMLGKYKRQLGDDLHKAITTPDKTETPHEAPTSAAQQEEIEARLRNAKSPGEAEKILQDAGGLKDAKGNIHMPAVPFRRQKTSRGERSMHSFSPGNAFWDARKAGKIPSNVTVRKDPRSGRWEATIWGDNDKEIHDTIEAMRKAGVRM